MPGATITVKATYDADTKRYHRYTLDTKASGILPETLYIPKNGKTPVQIVIELQQPADGGKV